MNSEQILTTVTDVGLRLIDFPVRPDYHNDHDLQVSPATVIATRS